MLIGISISWAEPLRLADSGTALAKVVISEDATIAEKNAAEQLAHYLGVITDAPFDIAAENNVAPDALQILVGKSERARQLLDDIDLEKLNPDEIIIKRVDNSLVITGGQNRGSLYATFQFLETFVGCRWWTKTENLIPKKPDLQIDKVDVRYAPPFWYRTGVIPWGHGMESERFITQMRDNGNREEPMPEWGGRYEILGWVHTYADLLPLEKYFKDHPEWYTDPENQFLPCTPESKMPGAQETELCTTNPEVVEELARHALAQIKAKPEAGYISISQNDNDNGYCRCSRCAKLVKEEGSPSALTIQFANRIAEKVGAEYPDFMVETLAYHFSEKPPKTIKPAKNVIIRMAPINRDFGHPYLYETNAEARQNLQAWRKIGAEAMIWDYVTNFHHVMMPHPNLLMIGDAMSFYKENGVKAIFTEGNVFSNGVGDFAPLRTWLIAQLMWNPDQDSDALINEYLNGYYGDAAPYLREYIDLISAAFLKQNRKLSTFNGDFSYLTLPVMNRATELFDKAAAQVAADPVFTRRVARERMSIDLAWLWQYRDYKQIASREQQPFLGPEDPRVAMEKFEANAVEFGIDRYRSTVNFEYLPRLLKRYLAEEYDHPVAISKKLGIKTNDGTLDIQENGLFEEPSILWPAIVEDPRASNGKAGELKPGGKNIQIHFTTRGFSMKPGKWNVYVIARKDGHNAHNETTIRFGNYDRRLLKDTVSELVSAKIEGDDYKVFDCGVVDLHPESAMWLSYPEDGSGSILIDRLLLVPKD